MQGDLEAARTPGEATFLRALLANRDDLIVWPRSDSDGTLWLCVSRDYVERGAIRRTLRLDYDGVSLRGGWSPGLLNRDDGVRAEDAGVETKSGDGLAAEVTDPAQAAEIAAQWFDAHSPEQ